MPRVTTRFLQEYDEIPLPPLEQQQKIVLHLNQLNEHISTLKTQYQHQLSLYDELREATLDKAFK
jgi:restriction endonuclease S subunit